MSRTAHLQNFPFADMSDFNSAFAKGLAEPVLPSNFARKWATKDKTSSVKFLVVIFNSLIPTLCLGFIVYLTINSEGIKWFHALGAFAICIFSFSPNISSRFRTIFTILLLIVTAYLYWTHSQFAHLIGISFGLLVSLKIADYFALKDIVTKTLSDIELTTRLWDHGVLGIRYPNGRIIFKEKEINLGQKR